MKECQSLSQCEAALQISRSVYSEEAERNKAIRIGIQERVGIGENP